jgi:hypothetical protein
MTLNDYKNGLLCEWGGKRATNMTRNELFAFVGMLDTWATYLAQRCGLLVEKSCLNCGHYTTIKDCLSSRCMIKNEKEAAGGFFDCCAECGKHQYWMYDGSGSR